MTILFAFGALLLLLTVAALPGVLLVYAAVTLARAQVAGPAMMIGLGAVTLTAASLDFLVTMVVARGMDAEALASFTLYSHFISMGLQYLGLWLIAFGVLGCSRKVRVRTASIGA